ncbi:MAG TPA: SIS domain-containing protein [Acidimicrobiia bacterium]|nr:SIS domain-containing protein [Acidimicrobiia bacterium]
MAQRFRTGGRLLVVGSGSAGPDARHVAVEFVHPVIVGKRAVPAVATGADAVATLARPDDVLVGISHGTLAGADAGALATAGSKGALTVALCGDAHPDGADHAFAVPSDDRLVVREMHVTLYHLLWELAHVFLDHRGAGEGASDLDALYPFLAEGDGVGDGDDDGDGAALLADAAQSSREKAEEIASLRERMLEGLANDLDRCAAEVGSALDAGSTVWTFGNGGSSTDADALAEALLRPPGGAPSGAAVSLSADVAVTTALANDVGIEVVFARPLAGMAQAGDVAVGLSTSGNSANVVTALEEAKRRGLVTVGFAGNEGGRMAECGALDHLFVVLSSSVHRIQEAQTTLYHALVEQTSRRLGGADRP